MKICNKNLQENVSMYAKATRSEFYTAELINKKGWTNRQNFSGCFQYILVRIIIINEYLEVG